MTVPPDLSATVRAWLTKAGHDLKNAEHTLKLPDPECPLDTVCFHAQQCIEKSIKAYLTLKCVSFQRTHDLGQLIFLCRVDADLVEELDGAKDLSHYAVDLRYADVVAEEPDRAEAEQAVRLARRAHEAITKRLKGGVVL